MPFLFSSRQSYVNKVFFCLKGGMTIKFQEVTLRLCTQQKRYEYIFPFVEFRHCIMEIQNISQILKFKLGISKVLLSSNRGKRLSIFSYVIDVQSTPDNSNLQGKSKNVRVIGSSSYREFEANNRK